MKKIDMTRNVPTLQATIIRVKLDEMRRSASVIASFGFDVQDIYDALNDIDEALVRS